MPTANVTTCAGTSPITTTGGTPAYTLAVDVAQKGAAWSRFYERGVAADHAYTLVASAYPNGRGIGAALKKGHDQAGFQYVRFHGVLDSDVNVYSEDASGAAVYNWTNFDAVYDTIMTAGMRPVVEISFMPDVLASTSAGLCCPTCAVNCPWLSHYYGGHRANEMPPKDMVAGQSPKWQALMAAIVTHLEGRYGAAEVRNNWYFEVWNESSWMYALGNAGYNALYAMTVRGLLQGDSMIRVGGPAESGGGSQFMISSLISYTRTNNLKLDFVSYHNYGTSPLGMLTFNQTSILANAVKAANPVYPGEVLNDEFAISPFVDLMRDTEVSAAFIAKTIHLLGTDPLNPPPSMYAYWVISDFYEEVNTGTNTAYLPGNFGLLLRGDARFPESFDLAKPAFNSFRLLHAMGDTRLATTGGTTADGVGAQATISSDGSAIQVLVYNYVNGGTGNSSTSSLVTLTVNNLPFAATALKVRRYVVDRTHSNSYTAWVGMGSPAQPTQPQWATLSAASDLCYYDTTATRTGTSWTATFPVNVNSVNLIVLSP